MTKKTKFKPTPFNAVPLGIRYHGTCSCHSFALINGRKIGYDADSVHFELLSPDVFMALLPGDQVQARRDRDGDWQITGILHPAQGVMVRLVLPSRPTWKLKTELIRCLQAAGATAAQVEGSEALAFWPGDTTPPGVLGVLNQSPILGELPVQARSRAQRLTYIRELICFEASVESEKPKRRRSG